jgi:type II secretory pathway pseudopilin PulG
MTRTLSSRTLSSSARRLRAGYTIVELLIVTSVLTVVTVMSAGRIAEYMSDRNAAAAAAVVQNDLQKAFAIAARNRRPVRVSFSVADTALRITDRDNTVTYVRRGLGVGSGFMLRPSDVTFCTHECTNAFVDVFPNGWASDTLKITVGRDGHARGLRMSRSGLIVVAR